MNRVSIALCFGIGIALTGLVSGCSTSAIPSGPSALSTNQAAAGGALTAASSGSSVSSIASRNPGKVSMCHVSGQGAFDLLSVAGPAEAAHLAHGDGRPGDPFPEMGGYIFGQGCEPVLDQCHAGSSGAGASSGAIGSCG